MKHYRVYKLNETTNRIMRAKDLEAPDDSQALKEATKVEECPTCEVWQGTKVVGKVLP